MTSKSKKTKTKAKKAKPKARKVKKAKVKAKKTKMIIVCPFCNGRKFVFEPCYKCGEFGCLECDGLGVFDFPCEFCNKPGWEKRIPADLLEEQKRAHRLKLKLRDKKRKKQEIQRERQICILVADQKEILLFCEEVKDAVLLHGDDIENVDLPYLHFSPLVGAYVFPPEEPARSNAIQEILGEIELKTGLVIRADQLKLLPVKGEENNIAATLTGLPKKLPVEFYWVDRQDLHEQNIKGNEARWVSFDNGREIVSKYIRTRAICMM